MKKPKKAKNRSALIKYASRRLSQNPHDPIGLSTMGGIYYEEQDWEKAYASYSVLTGNLSTLDKTAQTEAFVRCGICAIKTHRSKEAKIALRAAYNIDSRNFDVNYNLGYICFLEKDYEKAVSLFRRALLIQKNNFALLKYLGFAYQKLKKYNEALPLLKKAVDMKPDDREVLFAMGECFYEAGMDDKALKILIHFRADPNLGSQAALYTGMLKLRANQLDSAAEDFKIGLKHSNIQGEILKELKYRLAQCLLKSQAIGEALGHLKDLQAISPRYKDVTTLIMRYQELNQNKNLQLYLMSGQSEFVGLCRKIVSSFYSKARIKILDIAALTEHTDIIVEVDTARYSDTVVFRFFRSQSSIGEFLMRDFHSKIKEAKGGTGICMTAGEFTEEAVRFTEGRPIELFDKKKLSKILNSVQ